MCRSRIRTACRNVHNNVPVVETPLPPPDPTGVVFCVTTYKRTWQLKITICANLVLTWRFRPWVTWVLVDLNPLEDLEVHNFVGEKCRPALWAKHLQLYKVDDATWTDWHASRAKNSSHMAAGRLDNPNSVFVNVDNDNILTEAFIIDVIQRASAMQPPATFPRPLRLPTYGQQKFPWNTCLRYKNEKAGGTTGRIVIHRDLFELVRGYDEDLGPMGYQDVDLAVRVKALGLAELVHADWVGDVVCNVPNQTKIKHEDHCKAKLANVDHATVQHFGGNWTNMNLRNMQVCKERMKAGFIVRNEGKRIGVNLRRKEWRFEGLPAKATGSGVSLLVPMPVPPAAPPAAAAAAAATAPPSFEIFTFGASKLAGSFPKSTEASAMKDLVGEVSRGPPIILVPRDMVVAAMSQCVQAAPDIVLDCRTFNEQDMTWRTATQGHTGYHHYAVQRITDHSAFTTVLRNLHQQVSVWEAKRKKKHRPPRGGVLLPQRLVAVGGARPHHGHDSAAGRMDRQRQASDIVVMELLHMCQTRGMPAVQRAK